MSSALTYDSLREAMKIIGTPPPRDPFGLRPFTFEGLPIYERPPEPPKIQVSESFEWMTPEARASMNAWLLSRFGRREDMPRFLMVSGMGLVVRNGSLGLLSSMIA